MIHRGCKNRLVVRRRRLKDGNPLANGSAKIPGSGTNSTLSFVWPNVLCDTLLVDMTCGSCRSRGLVVFFQFRRSAWGGQGGVPVAHGWRGN